MKQTAAEKLYRLNYILGEINSLYHEAALKFGLSDSVMTVLYSICASGESCMLSDIYKLSGVCKQTVNSALRKMEKDGLIYLENVGGKSKKAVLTDSGKKLCAGTAEKIISAENSILESWSDSEVGLYIELSRKYAEDFRKQLDSI